MDKTERVLIYDGLVNIENLEKMFNRSIIIGLEQIYSYDLFDSRDLLKTAGIAWLLYEKKTCYNIWITEEELEKLDDWYSVPFICKRTLIIALGKLCWIYYNNTYNSMIGESNLNIDSEKLKQKLNEFLITYNTE